MMIRDATVEDAGAIALIQTTSWQHTYQDILPAAYLAGLSVDERTRMWTDVLGKHTPLVLVALIDGVVVGFASIGDSRDRDVPPAMFEIRAIYLLPGVLSSGVGRELWFAARARAIRHCARAISLWVIATNQRAIRFYRAAGFEPQESSRKKIEVGGVLIESIRYVQSLEACAQPCLQPCFEPIP